MDSIIGQTVKVDKFLVHKELLNKKWNKVRKLELIDNWNDRSYMFVGMDKNGEIYIVEDAGSCYFWLARENAEEGRE